MLNPQIQVWYYILGFRPNVWANLSTLSGLISHQAASPAVKLGKGCSLEVVDGDPHNHTVGAAPPGWDAEKPKKPWGNNSWPLSTGTLKRAMRKSTFQRYREKIPGKNTMVVLLKKILANLIERVKSKISQEFQRKFAVWALDHCTLWSSPIPLGITLTKLT